MFFLTTSKDNSNLNYWLQGSAISSFFPDSLKGQPNTSQELRQGSAVSSSIPPAASKNNPTSLRKWYQGSAISSFFSWQPQRTDNPSLNNWPPQGGARSSYSPHPSVQEPRAAHQIKTVHIKVIQFLQFFLTTSNYKKYPQVIWR